MNILLIYFTFDGFLASFFIATCRRKKKKTGTQSNISIAILSVFNYVGSVILSLQMGINSDIRSNFRKWKNDRHLIWSKYRFMDVLLLKGIHFMKNDCCFTIFYNTCIRMLFWYDILIKQVQKLLLCFSLTIILLQRELHF